MGRSRVLVLREPVEVRVDFHGGRGQPILCFTNHELVNAIMRCVSEWPYGTVTIHSLDAPPRPAASVDEIAADLQRQVEALPELNQRRLLRDCARLFEQHDAHDVAAGVDWPGLVRDLLPLAERGDDACAEHPAITRAVAALRARPGSTP